MTPAQRARQDQINDYVKARRAKRIRWLNWIKLKFGCAICHYREHPAALDFDHIDPATKQFPITQSPTRNLHSIFAEIRKCRILCANCHRVETEAKRGRESFHSDDRRF
jgi:hypothetical protein